MSPSPNEQAYAARAEQRQDVLDYVASRNARLRSQYHEEVLAWIFYKQRGIAKPIPDPPIGLKAVDHIPVGEEVLYAERYPGILPMLDDAPGDPVAEKYVDTETPNPTGALIGIAVPGMPGWFGAGWREGATRYYDESAPGKEVDGTSRDGVIGRFRRIPGALGPTSGWWMKIA